MRKTSRAMTLIELIVTIAILSIVSLSLSKIILNFYKTNTFTLQQSQAVDSARKGTDDAMRSLREATYGDDGSYPIASAATSSITFYSNIDGDTSIEKVRYYLSSGTLYRGVTNSTGNPPGYVGQPEATSTIAAYVVNTNTTPTPTSVFRYFDSGGAELTSPFNISKIASVQTSMYIDVDPSRAPITFTLSESATLRNLRSNQ